MSLYAHGLYIHCVFPRFSYKLNILTWPLLEAIVGVGKVFYPTGSCKTPGSSPWIPASMTRTLSGSLNILRWWKELRLYGLTSVIIPTKWPVRIRGPKTYSLRKRFEVFIPLVADLYFHVTIAVNTVDPFLRCLCYCCLVCVVYERKVESDTDS